MPDRAGASTEGESVFPFLTCIAGRKPSGADTKPLARLVPKKPPAGFAANSPVAKYLTYDDAPEPGVPAPFSPVPLLASRYAGTPTPELRKKHEGAAEPLYGSAAHKAAAEHLEEGWTPENLDQFRRNELMCQQLFGAQWDPRIGETVS